MTVMRICRRPPGFAAVFRGFTPLNYCHIIGWASQHTKSWGGCTRWRMSYPQAQLISWSVKTFFGSMQSSFVAVVCLACTGDPACYQACPSGALQKRPGGGVTLIPDKCIGCRKCQSACIVGAVNFHEERKIPIICKHCGACTRFCPHGCLRMEEKDDVL